MAFRPTPVASRGRETRDTCASGYPASRDGAPLRIARPEWCYLTTPKLFFRDRFADRPRDIKRKSSWGWLRDRPTTRPRSCWWRPAITCLALRAIKLRRCSIDQIRLPRWRNIATRVPCGNWTILTNHRDVAPVTYSLERVDTLLPVRLVLTEPLGFLKGTRGNGRHDCRTIPDSETRHQWAISMMILSCGPSAPDAQRQARRRRSLPIEDSDIAVRRLRGSEISAG